MDCFFLRRAVSIAAGCVVGLGVVLPTAATAQEATFSCRASAIRVESPEGAVLLEPVVANDQGSPCATDNAGLILPLGLPNGLGSASVLTASTTTAGGAGAESGVTEVTLTLGNGIPAITATVLTAEASGACTNGAPALSSSSKVVSLTIGGDSVDIPPDQSAVDVPLGDLGSIHLNQTVASENEVVQRALVVDTILARIVIAEAIADVEGDPCAEDLPQCSDGVDNDGDGQIDFPNDPGCANEDDDTEQDEVLPQCSDGVDNDGDGKIDFPNDPGCANEDDDTEQGEDQPECSDDVDNDGDGMIDFPNDPGCSSLDDDSEQNQTCRNRSGGRDDTNPSGHGNQAGCDNPHKSKGAKG